MRAANAGAVLAASMLCGCMLVVADVPDSGPQPLDRDGGDSGPIGVGDGPSDRDGNIGFGDGPDARTRPVFGSGKDGDNGTGVLVLLRVDQGTANLAEPVVALTQDVVAALNKSGFAVTSAAVADLYLEQGLLWATRPDQSVPALSSVLLAASASRQPALPDRCTTAALIADGPMLQAWSVNRVAPFSPPPGALLVVMIDTGARPHPLSDCAAQALWASTSGQWALGGAFTHREQIHFLLIATPESGTPDTMRAHCTAVSGFPTVVLDALAPSANAFFDPLTSALNGASAGLATRVDLCDALGATATSTWEDFASRWYAQLELLR